MTYMQIKKGPHRAFPRDAVGIRVTGEVTQIHFWNGPATKPGPLFLVTNKVLSTSITLRLSIVNILCKKMNPGEPVSPRVWQLGESLTLIPSHQAVDGWAAPASILYHIQDIMSISSHAHTPTPFYPHVQTLFL